MRFVRTVDLLPKLQERFPDEDPKVLMKIIQQGMKQITYEQIMGNEIVLNCPKHNVNMTFYKYRRDPFSGR